MHVHHWVHPNHPTTYDWKGDSSLIVNLHRKILGQFCRLVCASW